MKRIYRVEAVDEVADDLVGGAVTQDSEGVEFSNCGGALGGFHALRFVEDDDGAGGTNVVDGCQAVESVAFLVDDAVCFGAVECVDGGDENLDTDTGCVGVDRFGVSPL